MRKDIGNRLRFEVFKRDSFTCQYCGRKSPDVVLQVDHIKPVCTGGDNTLLNLITSCVECNSGKGPLELDDNSAIERQRQQLDELNERRLQLEMMLEWREQMRGLEEVQIEAFAAEFARITKGYGINEHGRRDVKKWLKQFSLEELLEALEGSAQSYLKLLPNGEADTNCLTKVFTYVPRVAAVKRKGGGQDPVERQLFYIRGILRNRVIVNERVIMPLLRTAYIVGCDVDVITQYAKTVRNWTEFRTGIEEWIGNLSRQSGDAGDQNEVS